MEKPKAVLKPCPFCGGDELLYQDFQDHGLVKCSCGAMVKVLAEDEHFEQIEGNIYRKVERRSGGDLAVDAWNRRSTPLYTEAFL